MGVSICLGLYCAALSLLGLSAVLVQCQWLAWAVRLLGAAYRIYLGLRLIFSTFPAPDIAEQRPTGARSAFRFGFFITLTSPKAVVLFTSVFATSVTSSMPVRRRFVRARHWIERAAGAVFLGIGGRILSDARNPAF